MEAHNLDGAVRKPRTDGHARNFRLQNSGAQRAPCARRSCGALSRRRSRTWVASFVAKRLSTRRRRTRRLHEKPKPVALLPRRGDVPLWVHREHWRRGDQPKLINHMFFTTPPENMYVFFVKMNVSLLFTRVEVETLCEYFYLILPIIQERVYRFFCHFRTVAIRSTQSIPPQTLILCYCGLTHNYMLLLSFELLLLFELVYRTMTMVLMIIVNQLICLSHNLCFDSVDVFGGCGQSVSSLYAGDFFNHLLVDQSLPERKS